MKLPAIGLAMLSMICLHLLFANLTDEGLEQVAKLAGLESLNLTQTEISDADLDHLHRLTGLKELNLTLTFISEDQVRQLQAALPACKIQW